jgi:cytochrome d ubiquinol oxidase subunit II
MSELFTLENVVAATIVVALTGYALLGGADFGGGVWDLLASGPRREKQRELVTEAIGPIWEANHVWLIVVIVLLFTCFPPAFALLTTVLHIPLSLLLIGIVLRGSAFTFRTYDVSPGGRQERWGRIFAIASLITPILLGVSLGAIAAGGVRAPTAGTFTDVFIRPWLAPFPLAVGLLALALFSFLAAVFLTVEAEGDAELQEDFRRRALGAAAAVFVTAFGALLVAHPLAPRLGEELTFSAWALPLHVATGVAALTAIGALVTRRFRLARLAAGAQVMLILWGWALAQFPYLAPPSLTISAAAAPPRTLAITLTILGVGALVLIPSLLYLFRIFKGRRAFAAASDSER